MNHCHRVRLPYFSALPLICFYHETIVWQSWMRSSSPNLCHSFWSLERPSVLSMILKWLLKVPKNKDLFLSSRSGTSSTDFRLSLLYSCQDYSLTWHLLAGNFIKSVLTFLYCILSDFVLERDPSAPNMTVSFFAQTYRHYEAVIGPHSVCILHFWRATKI